MYHTVNKTDLKLTVKQSKKWKQIIEVYWYSTIGTVDVIMKILITFKQYRSNTERDKKSLK